MATKKATPKPLYQRVIERVEAQVIQLTAKVEKYERMDQSDINDVLDRIGKVVDNKQAGFIVSVGKEIATMLKRVGNAERGVSKAFNHLGKVEQCCRDQAAAIDAQGKLLHELAGQHAVLLNRFENRSEMNEKKLTMLDNRTTNLYHRVEDMEPGRGSPRPVAPKPRETWGLTITPTENPRGTYVIGTFPSREAAVAYAKEKVIPDYYDAVPLITVE
jgi:hypothetical protein